MSHFASALSETSVGSAPRRSHLFFFVFIGVSKSSKESTTLSSSNSLLESFVGYQVVTEMLRALTSCQIIYGIQIVKVSGFSRTGINSISSKDPNVSFSLHHRMIKSPGCCLVRVNLQLLPSPFLCVLSIESQQARRKVDKR